ncbi:MAG: HAD-IA family hydrolase [Marinicaulis sp.]|nr:HAD-IA family hydrolase [Marinicaulis sp.]
MRISLSLKAGISMADDLAGTAVLFDLDGTLIDTAEDLAASMNHALARANIDPISGVEVRHLVGYGARRMLMRGYQLSARREGTTEELDKALEWFLEHYQDNIAVHSRPFDGVVEMIERQRALGIRFAICTNKREAMAVLLLETLGVSSLFDAIIGADSASAAKPDPAPVKMCMEKLRAQHGVFVGDSDTDIRAARSVKMACFIARFGYGPLTLANEATALFDSYGEAAPLIEEALKV